MSLRRKPVPIVRSLADQLALMPPDLSYAYFDQAQAVPFQADAQAFSCANAWWLMELAFLVYVSDQAFIRDALAKVDLQGDVRCIGWNRHPLRSTEGMVVQAPWGTAVIFRGTLVKHPWDVVLDLAAVPVDWYGCGRVHLGFKMAVEEVWDELGDCLADACQHPERPLWVAGHSLGGAVATLFADRLHRECRPVSGLYTFGAPRVGGQRFQASFQAPAYRLVNRNDPVPHLPPGSPRPGWSHGQDETWACHVGELQFFDGRGRLHCGGPPTGQPSVQRRAALPRLKRWRHDSRRALRAFGDHAPKSYAVRVWNALVGRG